jgi:hypothetical protein
LATVIGKKSKKLILIYSLKQICFLEPDPKAYHEVVIKLGYSKTWNVE